MDLFKLVGKIAIDSSSANAEIDKTTNNSKSKFTQGIKTAAKWGAAIATGATVAVAGLAKFAQKTSENCDTVDKMSQKIGISKKAYQELDFICSQSGMSVDSLQAGMKTLTTQMDNAQDATSTSGKLFKELGVSVTDSKGKLKSQEDVLFDTISSLQGVQNQTEKARIATQLFGKSGTEMMPLLNGASGSIEEMKKQAHDLGLVLDDETIGSGVELTDTIDQIKRSFSSIGNKLGGYLLPIVENASKKVVDKLPEIIEKIDSLHSQFNKLSTKIKNAYTKMQEFGDWCSDHKDILEAIGIVVGAIALAVGAFIIQENLATIALTAQSVATGIATAATTAFGAVMAFVTSPITLVILAIGALIAIIVLCVKNWDKIKATVQKVTKDIKDKVIGMKDTVVGKFTEIKDGITEKINSIKENVKTKFNEIKEKMLSPIEKARDLIKGIVEKIKGFFNFKFEIPKIKVPHFKIDPEGWKLGDLLKGDKPKLSIDWYAKAMDNGMIMNKPTVFGVNGSQLMAGGEAGSETVVGTNSLMDMINTAVDSNNQLLLNVLEKILATIQNIDSNMYDRIVSALNAMGIKFDERELARLVRRYA